MSENTGWICPQCTRGVSPNVATCPCVAQPSELGVQYLPYRPYPYVTYIPATQPWDFTQPRQAPGGPFITWSVTAGEATALGTAEKEE